MDDLLAGVAMIATFETLFWIALGSILGIVLGALPGLTATMGVALMLPVSFYLPTATGMAMLLSVYTGAVAGASIPAILLGIPGNPNALATVRDGHAMTRAGQAGLALGSAAVASLVGGVLSLMVLILFAPYLAAATLAFGATEKFAIAALGLLIIAAMSEGNLLRGIAMGALGVCLSLLGSDPFTNAARLPFADTLASTPFHNGIELIPALIGLFGISQALLDLARLRNTAGAEPVARIGNVFPSWARLRSMWRVFLESTGIGTLIGAIPGAGASVAVFLAHERARKTSRPVDGEPAVGEGRIEGVIAPEAANNAVTGGALIPVLSLGIPGDAVTAVLLGALMIKGVVPGAALFANDMPLVYAIFLGMGAALMAMFVFQLLGVRLFPLLLRVPLSFLIPCVLILSCVGTFAVDGQAPIKAGYNMAVALALGVVGYWLRRAEYPIAPLVLGLILGPMLEDNYRLAVKLAQGDHLVFLYSPIVLGMVAVMALATLAARGRR
ncbi:MAG: tripartite tricarboxylate transporter permease [Rhodobacteraceae bacterium]|nr:tripartite tricarboxylate transporter permease [Paracoccaceae bacterium]